MEIFAELAAINARPAPYACVTTTELWTDEHLSRRMLEAHLDPEVDLSSYRGEFIARSTAWLIDRFGLGAGKRVADLGCGPGLYALPLAESGASVTGVDLSARSLRYASAAATQRGVAIRYLCRDYLRLELDEEFDLVILVMRDYCALPPESRSRLLRVVRGLLRPGGRFCFDVDSTAAFATLRESASYAPELMDGFWSSEPYFGFHNVYRYEAEQLSLDKFEILERRRRRTFYNWVRYFTPETLSHELRAAGFEHVEPVGDLAGATYDPDSPLFAVVTAPSSDGR